MVQFGINSNAVRQLELSSHAVEIAAFEIDDFALALHDEPYGYTLHATSRKSGLNLVPKHGRKLESDDAVQDATGLLGIDQIQVYLSRMLDSVQDGGLGDFVENDALGGFGLQAQYLVQMP